MTSSHRRPARSRFFGALVFLMFAHVASTARAQQPQPKQPLEPLPPGPPSSNPTTVPPPTTPSEPPSNADFGASPPVTTPEQQQRDTPPQQPSNEEQAKVFRPSFKGAGGYQYAQVHGVPINAARIRLGVGGQNDTQAHYAQISVLIGSTLNGLHTTDFRVGWNADLYRTSILRLGIDIDMGYLVLHRATQDAHIWALGAGAGVHASVDAFAFGPRDDHAVFVEGRFEGHVHFGPAGVWGPSVLAGLRY